jgi:hypothetical protein
MNGSDPNRQERSRSSGKFTYPPKADVQVGLLGKPLFFFLIIRNLSDFGGFSIARSEGK